MLFHPISSHITVTSLLLLQAGIYIPASAYKPLSDDFLRSIKAEGADFDAQNGRLLAPILTPRFAGSPGHASVQRHFASYFQSELSRWSIEWHNTTVLSRNEEVDLATLVVRREPPWTKPGQANFLTFAAHYDSHESYGNDPTAAAPCAVLMHMAKSIDPYMTQMYDEMVAIGEGGEPDFQMDMGVQIMLFDGRETLTRTGRAPSLYGSSALAESFQAQRNSMDSNYTDTLAQIRMFVLLDFLGSAEPQVPAYSPATGWVHSAMATVEDRMRRLQLLESKPAAPFFTNAKMAKRHDEAASDVIDDHSPFERRGVPVVPLVPSAAAPSLPRRAARIPTDGLDASTVRDWARIVTGFALEWLDMMEVWPEEGQ